MSRHVSLGMNPSNLRGSFIRLTGPTEKETNEEHRLLPFYCPIIPQRRRYENINRQHGSDNWTAVVSKISNVTVFSAPPGALRYDVGLSTLEN